MPCSISHLLSLKVLEFHQILQTCLWQSLIYQVEAALSISCICHCNLDNLLVYIGKGRVGLSLKRFLFFFNFKEIGFSNTHASHLNM